MGDPVSFNMTSTRCQIFSGLLPATESILWFHSCCIISAIELLHNITGVIVLLWDCVHVFGCQDLPFILCYLSFVSSHFHTPINQASLVCPVLFRCKPNHCLAAYHANLRHMLNLVMMEREPRLEILYSNSQCSYARSFWLQTPT